MKSGVDSLSKFLRDLFGDRSGEYISSAGLHDDMVISGL